MAQTELDPSMLEACVRDVLNVTAPRLVGIIILMLLYSINR